MFRKILIASFCFFTGHVSAQSLSTDSAFRDSEQHQLELCYHYSNLFGYEVDTIANPELYKAVSDWLGTSYCYAGDSKNGVDCSGFVSALYKSAFSIDLEGSSRDIFKNIKPLKKSQLREGDMVFFRIRKKRVSHIGVYLGHNKFAHASVHDGVIISDIEDPYYKKYFYKGGRLKVKSQK